MNPVTRWPVVLGATNPKDKIKGIARGSNLITSDQVGSTVPSWKGLPDDENETVMPRNNDRIHVRSHKWQPDPSERHFRINRRTSGPRLPEIASANGTSKAVGACK